MHKAIPQSFITEHMIFDTAVMRELLAAIEQNEALSGSAFYEKILAAVEKEELLFSGFSEFETYGTYLYTYHREKMQFRSLKTLRDGKRYVGAAPGAEELAWLAESYDTVSIEKSGKESKFSFLWRNRWSRARLTADQTVALYEKVSPYEKIYPYYAKLKRKIKKALFRVIYAK